MADERKEDLRGPDEEALEEHVREMLDVTVPDAPQEPAVPEPTPKSTKITVLSTGPESTGAPKVPRKNATKKGTVIAVTNAADEPVTPVEPMATDPELAAAIELANKELAEQAVVTAPLVPDEANVSPGKSKKVQITHFEETPSTVEPEEELEPVEPTIELEPTAPEEPAPEESPLEPEITSPATEQAVNEIIATEGDELLAMKDEKLSDTVPDKAKKSRKKNRNPFKSSAFRWLFAFVILAGLLALALVPTTRYAALNAAGVRSSASVLVLDRSTEQPLKNVTVSLAGQKVQTDSNGAAKLDKLRLGPTELVIEKRAFAAVHRAETIGWGSNPLADVSLTPTGTQYSFTVTDAISGKPLGNATATYGDSDANADEKGVITITFDKLADKQQATVQIKAVGYRDEKVDVALTSKQNIAVAMIPAHKVAFVSKRSGTYDIYKIDADGKNEQLVLKGTGNEQSNLTLAPHPTEEAAVLISSRDGKRAADNTLLTSLTFVNLKDGSTKQVAQSSSIRPIDWIGTRFIYVQTTSDAKSDDPARDKLMSFDYVSGDNRQLATSNYFNDLVTAGNKIYYAPSSAYQQGVNLGMFSVLADGSGKQSIFGQEVWTIAHTSYDHLILAVQQDWYDYTIGDGKPNKLNGQPSNSTSRLYVNSPDSKQSVWLDDRDGKGTLVLYDANSKTERVLFAKAGLKGPVRWINNSTLVFRYATATEIADYVVSINGGEPKKVTNVTDTKGLDRYTY